MSCHLVTLKRSRAEGAGSAATLPPARVIDDSAADACRDPRAIRRLLNIGLAEATPERLADLALTYGVSGFVLGADDPRAIQRFGQEVAPATRELVDDERAAVTRPTAPGGARRAARS